MAPRTIPLREPLPGGRPGATVTVQPLVTGEIQAPPALFERASGWLAMPRALGVGVPRDQWWWVPAPVFLLRHPTAGALLVDAGLHSSVADDPARNLGRVAAKVVTTRMRAEQGAARQLAAHGLAPEDLAAIVFTHLHLDHASGLSELPPVTTIVSEAEWHAATTARAPLLAAYRSAHLSGTRDWRTLDLDGPLARPHAGFPRTIDLLGDGSVRLVSTPGHTPGHCSVLCRLEQGELLIAGDAAYTLKQLAPAGPEPPRPANRVLWRQTIERLRAYAAAKPETTIIAGHDARQWRELPERYL